MCGIATLTQCEINTVSGGMGALGVMEAVTEVTIAIGQFTAWEFTMIGHASASACSWWNIFCIAGAWINAALVAERDFVYLTIGAPVFIGMLAANVGNLQEQTTAFGLGAGGEYLNLMTGRTRQEIANILGS